MKKTLKRYYVTEFIYLGNIFCTISDLLIVDHEVNDLCVRTNCLIVDFSSMDITTLSPLFNTYCANIYGSPL